MLTAKQLELLRLIHRHTRRTGVAPSFEEMKEAVGLKSKSGIHRLITALEDRGFVRRLPHRARALEVLKLPESLIEEVEPAEETGMAAANVVSLDAVRNGQQTSTLPLLGKIAAGTPIEALRDPDSVIDIPAGLIGRGSHYALEISGDSMIEAGILDGDTVLIQETDRAENGEIVVALIDRHEATLKRLRRRGGAVALEAANPAYETQIYPPERVQIQGRLVSLIRRYS